MPVAVNTKDIGLKPTTRLGGDVRWSSGFGCVISRYQNVLSKRQHVPDD